MDITAITSQLRPTGLEHADASNGKPDPAKLAKVSRQFESILLRQMLGSRRDRPGRCTDT